MVVARCEKAKQIKSYGTRVFHGIDGNNIQEMKIAREELNEYLIERK